MGFEPTRAEHIGLAVQRLNHSDTSSCKKTSAKSEFHPHTSGISYPPIFIAFFIIFIKVRLCRLLLTGFSDR